MLPLIAACIALVALLVAGGSLWVSISSRRLAGKSYTLTAAKEERQAPKIELYLVDALQAFDASGTALLSLTVQVTNLSEVATSLRSIWLDVHYAVNGKPYMVEVAPTSAPPPAGLVVPRSLGPKDTEAGDVHFRLSRERVADWRITSYSLAVRDADGEITRITDITLRREL